MIDIVVVNWNSGRQLLDVIASVEKYGDGIVGSVIVVDNASSDDSLDLLEAVKSTASLNLKVVRNTENRGFGAACNQGARLGSSEFVLFLNPDALLYPNSLRRCVDYMHESTNRNVGIVGVQLVDETGHVARSCSRFPAVAVFLAQATGINRLKAFRHLTQAMVEWPHDSIRTVDQVIGAYFFMRRDLFEALNGFDERFFVYFEEVDVARRASLAGYRSVYLSDAQAFHAGGGTSNQVKAHRLFYSLRSRMLYGFKHFSLVKAWILVLITLGLEPVTRVFFAMIKGEWSSVKNTLLGFRMLYADLPAIFSGARKT